MMSLSWTPENPFTFGSVAPPLLVKNVKPCVMQLSIWRLMVCPCTRVSSVLWTSMSPKLQDPHGHVNNETACEVHALVMHAYDDTLYEYHSTSIDTVRIWHSLSSTCTIS